MSYWTIASTSTQLYMQQLKHLHTKTMQPCTPIPAHFGGLIDHRFHALYMYYSTRVLLYEYLDVIFAYNMSALH